MDTFLVQVWAPADGAEPEGLRGLVRHIATGVVTPFRSADDVVRVLARPVRSQPQPERKERDS